MSQYFGYSQQVRFEIMQDKGLIETLRLHMGQERRAEYIRGGSGNNHYRIGQTGSGLWIGLRELKTPAYVRTTIQGLGRYESYAETAEYYSETGRIVSLFSIGVFMGINAALLVEDLTHGGKREIIHDNANEWGYIKGKPEEKIYLDLEREIEYEAYRYMDRKNSIDLSL